MPWLLLTLLHKGPEYGAELMWAKEKPARRTETSEQHLPHFQRQQTAIRTECEGTTYLYR